MSQITIECVRCGGPVPNLEHMGQYPGGQSRWDASIELCSACCHEEAMLQFEAMGRELDPADAVHPLAGERPWDNPPEWI